MFVGCKEYSKEDISTLYSSMQKSDITKPFFNGNSLQVNFDAQKINLSDTTDKSRIFEDVYKYYLKSSSELMFGVVDRVKSISTAVKDFNKSQTTDIYKKLKNVNECLINLADSKSIYETSNGNLHYKNVLGNYNSLIKSLYSLNEAFAEYYFVDKIGKADFSKDELSDSNVRDMLRYQMLLLSKVSFNYELLNFESNNPMGSIQSWFNSTYYLKDYVELCETTLGTLGNANDLGQSASPYIQQVKNLFAKAQDQELEYKNEYKLFLTSLSKFNLKAYFTATNKSAYLESRTNTEKSCYQIMQNFLNGRYKAYVDALTLVNDYI